MNIVSLDPNSLIMIMQAMAHTVKTSWKDLGLLFMLVGMGMLVFGSLLYYIENGVEETSYESIPAGLTLNN